jgi:putative ABC transport system permease protein
MLIFESMMVALRALTINKLRTVLTMLGIIIGVGSVIALVSIGNGVREGFNQQFAGLGTNVLWISSGTSRIRGPGRPPPPPGGGGNDENPNQRPAQPLTTKDAELIGGSAFVSNIVDVATEYRSSVSNVVRGQAEMRGRVTGVSPSYETVRGYTLLYGQFLTSEQIDQRARVAVLSQFVASELFASNEYPIGERIRIGGVPFEVIGVFEDKGQSGFGDRADTTIFIPITTAQTRLGKGSGSHKGSLIVNTIYIQATSTETMDSIIEQMTALMRDRHDLKLGDVDDFTIVTQTELLAFGDTFAASLTAFLGAIAGISLLVGGIGVMNIMLVSVTERTREIGIRKAVGAKRRDILLQFLVEAMVLSLIGGCIGIGLGYGVSTMLPMILPGRFSLTIVTWDSVFIATGFSAAIGLFFGVYPATRAASLKPIDALRYE